MHPYRDLEPRAFWSESVAGRHFLDIEQWWQPKWPIRTDSIVSTFGSCFAQRIGSELSDNGFTWLNTEPAPDGVSKETQLAFNYGVFSARTGNIYTATQLKQWVDWSLEIRSPPQKTWIKNGRFIDPIRPTIEPDGFESEAELFASRNATLAAFKRCILESNCFIFTLGLTESWYSVSESIEFTVCPGTVAGEFDESDHQFRNHTHQQVLKDLCDVARTMREVNRSLKILLTVSPVPLVATASGHHVLPATVYSKSVLRAVAGQLSDSMPCVDYFPSYEIIASAPMRSTFYQNDQRSVANAGVTHVMQHFFSGLERSFPTKKITTLSPKADIESLQNAICDEELLNAVVSLEPGE